MILIDSKDTFLKSDTIHYGVEVIVYKKQKQKKLSVWPN